MIIENQTPNFIAFAGKKCACCGASSSRTLNIPGNILVPACSEPGCPSQYLEGALEVGGPELSAGVGEAPVS